ncbi:GTP 3',8-cyclase MoaA [Proteinivorax tanatarense]|uniref:GTP 3',8-cyclase n=1 Tax=Proteinivorax tanatarense TaxID=1260629 RepID=A0AAU7VM29_9FIRM
MALNDNYGRKIDYIRVSLLDRCNLRCSYCMPSSGVELMEHNKMITYEELIIILRASAKLGIKSVRLTGGEPLIKKGFLPFVKTVSKIPGIEDIALTTNGTLLSEMAKDLKDSGINRLNISLDTLQKEKFKKITGFDKLSETLAGIDKAIDLGFEPIKLNVVLLKNYNLEEIGDFVKLTIDKPLHVRFIEMMPLGQVTDNWKASYISWEDVLADVKNKFNICKTKGPQGKGPASYYHVPSAKGTLGFISAVSNHFCDECNRLRVTSDGKLKTCLFSDGEVDLKAAANTNDVDKVIEALKNGIKQKPRGHDIDRDTTTHRFMSQIGG